MLSLKVPRIPYGWWIPANSELCPLRPSKVNTQAQTMSKGTPPRVLGEPPLYIKLNSGRVGLSRDPANPVR